MIRKSPKWGNSLLVVADVCRINLFYMPPCSSWVTRDMVGDRLKPLWPYFKRSDDIWRLRRGDPIAVRSCWNGMTVFDAKWFLPANLAHIDSVKPPVKPPIRFRTHPNCNVSECLLFSYDIHTSSTHSPLIFVNPRAVASESSLLLLLLCAPPRDIN